MGHAAGQEVRESEIRNHANLIWGIAELLRGDYKQADYGKVILPLVVMRRLDQALEATKQQVVDRGEELERAGIQNLEPVLVQVAGQQFFNVSSLSFPRLLDDPGNIATYLRRYIDGYSALARQVVDHFEFDAHIDRLDRANLLYQVIARTCEVDLHPDRVSNLEMGYLFEELIRRFAEQSNETAGEHFTPREVVRRRRSGRRRHAGRRDRCEMHGLPLAGEAQRGRLRGPVRRLRHSEALPDLRRADFGCGGTSGVVSRAGRRPVQGVRVNGRRSLGGRNDTLLLRDAAEAGELGPCPRCGAPVELDPDGLHLRWD